MTVRIAVVQPICHRPGTDEKNAAEAVTTVAAAAAGSSDGCAAKQGVLGQQWQRPELDDAIHPRPLLEAAE